MNKILLVEDDPDHAELIIDELNTGNINNEIILLKDGQELIDYFQETDIDGNVEMEFQIDLIISDLNLPKVHGMDVLKFLKNDPRYRSIPVIIFSTNTDSSTISEAYENGAVGFIIKPASFKEFAMNLRLVKQYWLVQNQITRIESTAASVCN
ncbi:MAG: response regulator [Candidatus Scalindua sp.]